MRRHINLAQIWCIVYNCSILFRNRIHYLQTFKKIPHRHKSKMYVISKMNPQPHGTVTIWYYNMSAYSLPNTHYKQMVMVIEKCSVSCHATAGLQVQIHPTQIPPLITTLHISAMSASLALHHGLLLQQKNHRNPDWEQYWKTAFKENDIWPLMG